MLHAMLYRNLNYIKCRKHVYAYTCLPHVLMDARVTERKESEHGKDLSRSAHKVQDNERSFNKRACNLRIHVSTPTCTNMYPHTCSYIFLRVSVPTRQTFEVVLRCS